MVDIKKEIDALFNDDWIETPVQFQGTDFTTPNNKRWISIRFTPIDRALYAFDGANGRKADTVQVQVLCYDKSTTKALELEDSVREFFECYKLQTVNGTVEEGNPDGLGVVNIGNDVYQTSSLYTIKVYN